MRYTFIVYFLIIPIWGWTQDFNLPNKAASNALHLVKKNLQNPITLHSAQAEYNWVSNGTNLYSNQLSYYGDFFVTSNWSIASIPFQVVINNQTYFDIANNNFSNASLHFDRDNYLDMLRNKMKGTLDAEHLLGQISGDPVEIIKKTAEQSLKKELEDINQSYGGELTGKINEIGDLNTIFTKDAITIRQQLLNSQYLNTIKEKENILAELVNKKNIGRSENPDDLKMLEDKVRKLKGAEKIISKIEEHRAKWESSGLLKLIKQRDLIGKKQLEQAIRDPNTIIRLAHEQFNLNGIQKFFLKVNKMNIGQNTLSASNLSANHLLNKGINSEFLNNNKQLLLGLGKMKSLNSVLDQNFTNVLQASDGMMKMASVGLGGNNKSARSRVSVMSFDQSMPGFANMALRSMRTSLVTTFSNEMQIGSRGTLVTEVSRSATNYGNVQTSDTDLENKPAFHRILGTDDLLRNMAFSLKYDDEIEEHQLSYGLHVGKTANGYSNPGSSLLSSGAKNIGFNIRKSLMNRRLQASLRSEMREYDYSEERRNVWRNFYSVMDVRWKLGKGQYIGMRYTPNKMLRIEEKVKSVMTSTSRLSVEGNITKNIKGINYRNNLSLSSQTNSYMFGTDQISSKSITISSFQNVVISQKLVYLNINYDHAQNSSDYVYMNSSFIIDAGTTYMLFDKINMSSALSYNSVEGWYRQAGIKQTITGYINDRFSINGYLDIRKNLALYQPLFYGPVRADISIHYIIKK